jgi:hypothetical protein
MKVCSNCRIEKELTEFNKHQKTKDGYINKCKICVEKYQKEYRLNNKEKSKEYNKKFRLNNKDYDKIYSLNNQKKIKEYQKEYRNKIGSKYYNKETAKIFYVINKEKIIESVTKYKKINKIKYNENAKKSISNRRLTDPLFKLKCNIRNLIYASIKKRNYYKKSKTITILGCSIDYFKQHLQNQFTKGMSWENAGKWHLDHIYPVSLAKDEEELIRLNHYTNFQPLWAKDNLQKGNKIINNKQLKLL